MLLAHFRKSLRAVVGSAAAPYGYTLSIWAAGAALVSVHGIPKTLAALAFVGGAVLGFAFVGALAYGGIPGQLDQERGHALLWGSLHFISVGLAVGAVTQLRRLFFPPRLIPPCLGRFASYLGPLLFGELFGVGFAALLSSEFA